MLDLRLFANMRFSAASGAVTVAFFTLFGFIFLITLYFQFVRGYGPLSTGVRLLPVALSVAAGSVAGTQLAVRAGTKLVVTTGLVAMAAFYGWVAATTTATLSYGVIAAQMVLYGLGLGLSSAPATESIMGAISRAKAGVGSAVNDSTRLVGGTLGVAIIGSVYASVYASRLTATMPAAVPAPVAAAAHQSVGAAYAAAARLAALGHPALGQALQHASTSAFLRGLTIGALVAGAVAAAGALLAALFLPAQPAQAAPPAQAARPGLSVLELTHEDLRSVLRGGAIARSGRRPLGAAYRQGAAQSGAVPVHRPARRAAGDRHQPAGFPPEGHGRKRADHSRRRPAADRHRPVPAH
jgi:hypothetical protein